MKNKDIVLERLRDFLNSADIWDTEEYTQATMVEEIEQIISLIEKTL